MRRQQHGRLGDVPRTGIRSVPTSAGTAAAPINNRIGIPEIAPEAKLLSVMF